MDNQVFLGIDGGGTYTRAAIVDIEGHMFSHLKWDGGASIYKTKYAKSNVCNAVTGALQKAGCDTSDVISAAAGIAGYDSESDLPWVRGLTDIPGLNCTVLHVNDAVIAQTGAFLSKPGIIAINRFEYLRDNRYQSANL